jgi:hypothetical protein
MGHNAVLYDPAVLARVAAAVAERALLREENRGL